MPSAATTGSAGSRARRLPRPSGDERQRAILETTERLLAERPFSRITIDDLAVGAGLSRPTFYFYFASKQAVLLQLLDRMVAEVDARLEALPRLRDDREAWWRGALGVFVDVFSAHRSVTLALEEARAHPEVAEVWADRSGRWMRQTADVIALEQRRGAARTGVHPLALSTALNAMNERVIAASVAGGPDALEPGAVLDTLAAIWLGAIYPDH